MRGRVGRFFLCLFVAGLGIAGIATPAYAAPALMTLSLSASSVDISNADRTVIATMRITTDSSLSSACLSVDKPGTTETFQQICFNATARTSGTATNGVYDIPIFFPRYSHSGDYKLSLSILGGGFTSISNATLVARGLPSKINAFGNSDIVNPTLTGFAFTSGIDIGPGAQYAYLDLTVTDDKSGFLAGCVDLARPSAPTTFWKSVCAEDPANRTSGTSTNGTYRGSLRFEQTAELGVYPVLGFAYTDRAFNVVALSPAQMAAKGWPTTFTVTDTGPVLPGEPRYVSASSGIRAVNLSWLDPLSTGGSPLTSYTVTHLPSGTIYEVPPNETHLSLPAAPLSKHSFSVRANNAVGAGPTAFSPEATVQVATPLAPGQPTAVAHDGVVDVDWPAVVDDGGSPLIDYRVGVVELGGQNMGVPPTQTHATYTGLVGARSYTFRVTARNSWGESVGSPPTETVFLSVGISDAPPTVTTTLTGRNATVTWTAPTNNGGAAITGYRVKSAAWGLEKVVPANQLSTTFENLTWGGTYQFTVQAINAVGDGIVQYAQGVVPRPEIPIPGGVIAGATAGGAYVSWTTGCCGGNVSTYTVTASPGGQTLTVPYGNAFVEITGLTSGVSYTFSVHATNSLGNGEESAPSNAIVPLPTNGTPSAPSNVVATAGDGKAVLTWTASTGNGAPVTEYVVTANPGGATKSTNSNGVTFTGLLNGTSYTFTVHAVNALGNSAESAPSNAVVPAGPGNVPSPPTNVAATAGDRSALLTWTPPNGNGSPVTEYIVTANPGGATKSTTSNSVSFSGLTNGTPYTFTVHAKNGVGNSTESAPSNAVTPAGKPSDPTMVSAVGGDGNATVSWSAASPNGSPLTGYTVTASPGGATSIVAGNQTSAPISGLTNGVAYTFTVRATNAVGDSAESSPSNAVTPAATVVETGRPLVAMTAPGATIGLTRAISVRWVGADISGIDHFDVRRRSTAWNWSPGAWTSWKPSTTSTSATDTGNYGRTICYSARAEDGVGNMSNWSSQRCTVVPLNSDQLSYSSGWKRTTNAAAFAGFNRYTKTKGAKMTRTSIVAKGLSLVTTKCPTCGRVEVRWNGQLLKTFNLASTRTAKKQVLSIANWSTAKKGTLTVTNVSASGKQVNIEGVAVYNG